MKKETLTMYGQEIDVYTIGKTPVNIQIKGLGDFPEKTMFMRGGELLPGGERKTSSYYAEGHVNFESVAVVAEGIDQKQLANIFLSRGITEASYVEAARADVTIEAIKEAAPYEELAVSLKQAIAQKEEPAKKPAAKRTRKK